MKEEESCRRNGREVQTSQMSTWSNRKQIKDILWTKETEPEEEGDTRFMVAICSKEWFGVAARLNGQRHFL